MVGFCAVPLFGGCAEYFNTVVNASEMVVAREVINHENNRPCNISDWGRRVTNQSEKKEDAASSAVEATPTRGGSIAGER